MLLLLLPLFYFIFFYFFFPWRLPNPQPCQLRKEILFKSGALNSSHAFIFKCSGALLSFRRKAVVKFQRVMRSKTARQNFLLKVKIIAMLMNLSRNCTLTHAHPPCHSRSFFHSFSSSLSSSFGPGLFLWLSPLFGFGIVFGYHLLRMSLVCRIQWLSDLPPPFSFSQLSLFYLIICSYQDGTLSEFFGALSDLLKLGYVKVCCCTPTHSAFSLFSPSLLFYLSSPPTHTPPLSLFSLSCFFFSLISSFLPHSPLCLLSLSFAHTPSLLLHSKSFW